MTELLEGVAGLILVLVMLYAFWRASSTRSLLLLLAFMIVVPLVVLYVPSTGGAFERYFPRVVSAVIAARDWAAAQSATPILLQVGTVAAVILLTPVGLFTAGLLWLWNAGPGWLLEIPLTFNTLANGPTWTALPLLLYVGGSLWAFWSTVVSRSMHFIGVWDPFWRGARRGGALSWYVKLRDALEMSRFGREPTAAWANIPEVLSNTYSDGDVFLGRPRLRWFGMLRPVGIPIQKHMVTIAGMGSGKSTAGLIPNLCIHDGSLLCIDPKGELATITARRRGSGGGGVRGMGQAVFVLDPFKTTQLEGHSAAYNVFDEMERMVSRDREWAVSFAGKLADALVITSSDGDQAYWDKAAHTYLRGLILYMFVHEPKATRTLGRLRELVVQGDLEGRRKAIQAGQIADGDLSGFDVLIAQMEAVRGGPYGGVIAGTVDSLRQMGDRQMGGVITAAQEHTAFLDAEQLQHISERSDFLLDDLKDHAISVYLCLPLNMMSGKEARWLRMFVMLFIDMMMLRLRDADEPPVLLAIDEFPSLGRLEGIEKAAAAMRAHGVRLWMVGQDMGQFERVYGRVVAESLIGSAAAVQFMGITHARTVDYISQQLGWHVVHRAVKAGQQWKSEAEERPLLYSEQVARLLAPRRQNQIILRGDERPMLLKTAPYFWYMPAWYYDKDPHYRESWRRRWRRRPERYEGSGALPFPQEPEPPLLVTAPASPSEISATPSALVQKEVPSVVTAVPVIDWSLPRRGSTPTQSAPRGAPTSAPPPPADMPASIDEAERGRWNETTKTLLATGEFEIRPDGSVFRTDSAYRIGSQGGQKTPAHSPSGKDFGAVLKKYGISFMDDPDQLPDGSEPRESKAAAPPVNVAPVPPDPAGLGRTGAPQQADLTPEQVQDVVNQLLGREAETPKQESQDGEDKSAKAQARTPPESGGKSASRLPGIEHYLKRSEDKAAEDGGAWSRLIETDDDEKT